MEVWEGTNHDKCAYMVVAEVAEVENECMLEPHHKTIMVHICCLESRNISNHIQQPFGS